MIPVFAKKHCRIIQRRGIRARLLRVPLRTAPPPISAYIDWPEYNLWITSIDARTTMTARKPHFFNVRHRFGFCILTFEMSQPSCTGAVNVDIVAFAARHLMALDTSLVIVVCWAVPCTGFETTSLSQWGPFFRTRKEISTHTRHSSRDKAWRKYLILLSTRVNGSRRGIKPTESTVSLTLFAQISARTLIWRDRSNTDHTPTNSISTLIENARLKAVLCFQPVSSSVIYILYAKGTCW